MTIETGVHAIESTAEATEFDFCHTMGESMVEIAEKISDKSKEKMTSKLLKLNGKSP
jgi:hypothetical protein